MAELSIPTSGKPLSAYLATPDAEGPWPGVVVLHDIMGFTDDVRRQADWLAAGGFLSLAPNLYSDGGMARCVRSVFRDLFSQKGGAFDNIQAARAALAARPDCTGKVGVIGFCMGGGFALVAAAGQGFSASSVNYGVMPKNLDEVVSGACPIIGSFGAKDVALKGAAQKLTSALRTAHVEGDVKEYPDVGHAFMNDHSGFAGWLTARIGMGYNEAAASDARERIVQFFRRHLS